MARQAVATARHPWRVSCKALVLTAVVQAAVAAAFDWAPVLPNDTCAGHSQYFDTVVQRCMSCQDIDANASLVVGAGGTGVLARCACGPGFVQCAGGETCSAGTAGEFTARGPFECRQCPSSDGQQTVPSRDRRRCMACDSSTLGVSTDAEDCLCPAGAVLQEVADDWSLLAAKRCIACASGLAPGPSGRAASVYGCGACPDPAMVRAPATGTCECRSDFRSAGGTCVAASSYSLVTDRFPEIAATKVTYRDLIDGRESWWRDGPFDTKVGLASASAKMTQLLGLASQRTETPTMESATVLWLYVRCATGCLNGNATACQCVSNLCVLQLYEDVATVCSFLVKSLYADKQTVHFSDVGKGIQGLPWLFYADQTATEVLADASLEWQFTLSDQTGGPGTANTLKFWLASYSLEGDWLGWQPLVSQLDLCTALGGSSLQPRSPSAAWRRFASSLVTQCAVPLANVLHCGANPVFYDLFIENVDGSLVPVPVRIANLVKDGARPNLNVEKNAWYDPRDVSKDVLVRRFFLCDSVSGIEGGPEGYLSQGAVPPTVFRWAAHMAMEVRVRPHSTGQIYVPVLSIAYAEKKTAGLSDGLTGPITFKAEYSADSKKYQTVYIVVLLVSCALALALAAVRLYLIDKRYPLPLPLVVPGGDMGLFVPKWVLLARAFIVTMLNIVFWFEFVSMAYWLIIFKAQHVPDILLPSAFDGHQYDPHDAMLVLLMCLSGVSVTLDLARHLKVFVFLVDWERGAPITLPGGLPPLPTSGPRHPSMTGDQPSQFSQYGQLPGSQVVGAPLLGAGAVPSLSLPGSGMPQLPPGFHDGAAAPDSGISAWRTLFVCNQLNERLASTRTVPHVTWLVVAGFLEGLGWQNAARWCPKSSGDDALLSAQLNPFLQFALGTSVWLLVLLMQLVVRRVSSIFFGHECCDVVDVCSVANVSVLFMDEPYHGYYIHGKAPSSRGDWCHTDLARVLHDEDKGIGLSRGLTSDGCQTFELFFPPDMAVQMPGGIPVHFRQTLVRAFGNVKATQLMMASRKPEKPTVQDITEMSHHRCSVQALTDAMVHAVMRWASEVIVPKQGLSWFWGTLPKGGVSFMRTPLFYKDLSGLAWCNCLAYGSELTVAGISLPTGFEWHLCLFELMLFSILWRFQGSVGVACAGAFILNQVVLGFYAYFARLRLAHTTVINSMFLLGGAPRTQGLIYMAVAIAVLASQSSK